jgi:hypothetical protein
MRPFLSSEVDVQRYVGEIRSVLLNGESQARQELLRRFVKSITLYGDHWARNYDACIDCNTSERPHRANGRCRCWRSSPPHPTDHAL